MDKARRCLVAFGAMLIVAAATWPSQSAAQSPVTLKAVTAWDKTQPFVDLYMEWIKRVNAKAGGKVRIDYVGGPEVYPAFEQLDPLKRGVIGTIVTSTAYVAGVLPEVNATWFGFGATPDQIRASGLAEALDKVTREKAGVTVIGFPLQMRFNVYLNRPIDKADLKGFKLRSTPIYDPVLKGLGAATVTLPPAELLTALQTGVVEGFAWPAVFVTGPGFARAIKYKVMPHWWVGTDIALMNAQAFDALSAETRKLLIDTMKDIEKDVQGYYAKKEKEEDAILEKIGVKIVELPAAEVERVKRLHWQDGTQAFLLARSPKYGPALKELMARFAPR